MSKPLPNSTTAAPETAAPETAAPETAAPEIAAPETAASGTAAPTTVRLDEFTSPELARASSTTLLVPLGATEQHGPHLAIGTDSLIATRWAEATAARVPGVIVAPTLPYGSSGEHQSFPGTVSIGHEALRLVLIELARSARHDFSRIVFVSGHAGNAVTLQSAVTQLKDEGHDARFVVPVLPGSDAHAGRTETALIMHLDPSSVRNDAAEAGSTARLPDIIDALRAGGVSAVSPNGVLGDPTDATAAEGATLFDRLVDGLTASLH